MIEEFGERNELLFVDKMEALDEDEEVVDECVERAVQSEGVDLVEVCVVEVPDDMQQEPVDLPQCCRQAGRKDVAWNRVKYQSTA